MPRARRAVLAVVALLAGACGGGSDSGGPDPVAKAEDPGAVLVNSQYPELPVEGLQTSYLLDTGLHLTHVLSFVDGLRMDEKAATDALRHFEQFRREVVLGVEGEEATLTYNVRPRNYPSATWSSCPTGRRSPGGPAARRKAARSPPPAR